MIRVFGIKNCDTVKKTLKHLEKNGLEFELIDFKKEIPTTSQIKKWKKFFGGWPVNTKGRTYKQLKDEFEQANDSSKMSLIRENTSLIKRPVLENDGETVALGYDPDLIDSL